MKLYAIVEPGTEYNDEYYSFTDHNTLSSKKVYTSREAAELAMASIEEAFYRANNPFEYYIFQECVEIPENPITKEEWDFWQGFEECQCVYKARPEVVKKVEDLRLACWLEAKAQGEKVFSIEELILD